MFVWMTCFGILLFAMRIEKIWGIKNIFVLWLVIKMLNGMFVFCNFMVYLFMSEVSFLKELLILKYK